MKKLSILVFFFAALLFSSSSMAQTTEDYFVGEWNVQIEAPMGTISVLLTLERVDGKLVGKFVDASTSTETKMNDITEGDNSLTLNFTSAEYGPLYFTLQREDDENVSGTLMDSLKVSGTRVKKLQKRRDIPPFFFLLVIDFFQ
jgi:hypothetical protein